MSEPMPWMMEQGARVSQLSQVPSVQLPLLRESDEELETKRASYEVAPPLS